MANFSLLPYAERCAVEGSAIGYTVEAGAAHLASHGTDSEVRGSNSSSLFLINILLFAKRDSARPDPCAGPLLCCVRGC